MGALAQRRHDLAQDLGPSARTEIVLRTREGVLRARGDRELVEQRSMPDSARAVRNGVCPANSRMDASTGSMTALRRSGAVGLHPKASRRTFGALLTRKTATS